MKAFLTLFQFAAIFLAISAHAQEEVSLDTTQEVNTLSIIDSLSKEADPFDSSKYFSSELKFAYYLLNNEQYEDGVFLLKKLDHNSDQALLQQRDSISYLLGWISYFNRDFDEAIVLLGKVSDSSQISAQSKFYKSICLVYTQQYDSAKIVLKHLDLDSGQMLWELSVLQLSAISLLERDYEEYDSLSQYLSGNHFQFVLEETEMVDYHDVLTGYKQKSPWIAGGLSALLPGLGKFYAGYIGLPIGIMSITIPLAAVAIEAALVAGILSPPFLILGGVFAIFYVGNIWGSALSVYTIKKEIYDEIDRNIVFDMHVPLRRVFW